MHILNLQDLLPEIQTEGNETIFYKNTIINFFRNEFIVIYKKTNNNLDIFSVNRQHCILFSKKNIIKRRKLSIITAMNLKCSNDFVYIYVEFIANNKNEYHLLSFDERLAKVTSIQLQFKIDFALINIFENNLFSISLQFDYTILTEYNKDLRKLNVLGQADKLLPFFFPNEKITDINISEKYFVYFEMIELNNQKQLILMNRVHGSSIKINLFVPLFSQITIKMNQYVYCFHSPSKQLFLFDFDANLIDRSCIPIIESNTYLMDSNKCQILFFNFNSKHTFLI